ncbi:beta family protein [Clostridium sp.]|uniref:beta family protein n=1 Tax=Clostridium sp. TaxID=1506 RepID=UPI0028439F5D|nr:beta family protein [Clostridium sp.]MDR3596873.1 beta family protein [Clostridium sp.]
MFNKKYILFFKTGDAELRALENFAHSMKNILPIIEITRGRKSRNDEIGKISKRLDKIEHLFKDRDICLDLTTDDNLANDETELLFNPHQGYKEWVKFLLTQKNKAIYKSIIPTILVDIDDGDIERNIKLQAEALCKNFKYVAYRNNIADDGCYDDIDLVKDSLGKYDTKLLFILDCEYITPLAWKSYANKISIRIENILKKIKDAKIVIISTSFPRNVVDIGNEDMDSFRLNEIDLYNEVIKKYDRSIVKYGDYGTINPIRNDTVIMVRGWVPRIDVPLENEIYYNRKKKGANSYSDTYIELARDYIIPDPRFPKSLKNNWGIDQIKLCAKGNSPGSSPSFWISVRMNIHIEQQLLRLGLV